MVEPRLASKRGRGRMLKGRESSCDDQPIGGSTNRPSALSESTLCAAILTPTFVCGICDRHCPVHLMSYFQRALGIGKDEFVWRERE